MKSGSGHVKPRGEPAVCGLMTVASPLRPERRYGTRPIPPFLGKESLPVHKRLSLAASAALLALALLAPSALAASSTVVISQVAFRGPTGGNDELIQLHNVSVTAQDIGGWSIWGSSQTGSASVRATVPQGTSLPAGQTFLFTNRLGYSGTVPGDVTYSTGISDSGGVQLRDAAGQVIDAVGSNQLTGDGIAFREGTGLSFPTTNGNDTFTRKDGPDTDDNAADFTGPVDGGGACAPDANGITRINQVQTLGPGSACENKTVKIHGIVTGVDDLYGSNFSTIFKGDSGVWVQEATHDPNVTTSEGIFVAGIARDPDHPAAAVGDDVTISGQVHTQFGLVELVPPGVGSVSSGSAQEVPLNSVATINATGRPLPPAVTIDPARAASQDPATRPYYRSLQGMRVKLDEGIADGGGTTKFREVFLTPGHTAQRLFRQANASDSQPWLDQPQEIGVAPDGGAGNPADPRLDWFSDTEIDLDLFDVAHNVVGPLTYSFSFYEVMPQLPVAGENDGEQPTITRGPINAAYPPAAPAQPPNTLRVASFNVENYFPAGTVNDGHTITPEEYAIKTTKIVRAIHDFLGDPDVIAVQEVAVLDGKNALTGLAQALGDYTPYIAANNDARGIAPGFLVKDGVTASNPRLLGQAEQYNAHSEGTCDLAGGPLFDRAPFALDIRKGDLDITALSNHWGSQSHEEACRVAEAEYVRQQAAALQAAGRNVLVAGDLNDFQDSPSLVRLQQGGTLTDLWSKASPDNAYSYKFDGHLQTLDHIAVTAGLLSRATDMRYVHFDNDYYERHAPDQTQPDGIQHDGTGVSDHDPPMVTLSLAGTTTTGDVSGTVPATLSLSLGGPVTLGAFVPGVGTDYTGTTTATVTSTAGDAQLSVLDASADHPGHLVNGAFALAAPLQVQAGGGAFAPLRADNGPLALKSWSAPVTGDQTTLAFRQTIGADEALRTGRYGKTLTFTLSTTQP
jgi:predicted extracellular nuclease